MATALDMLIEFMDDEWAKTIRPANDLPKEAAAELAALRAALEPLAKVADVLNKGVRDDTGLWGENTNSREPVRLTVGHARAARAVLSKTRR